VDSGTQPLILVVGRPLRGGAVKGWAEPATALPSAYFGGIRRAGGVPALLDPTPLEAGEAAALLGRFDGLVLTGGDDLDPALYGEAPHEKTVGINHDSDAFELALLRAALDADVPTLAICRGLQLLNVAHGGTLDQHITGRDDLGTHGVPSALGGGPAVNQVQVESDSLLAQRIGTTEVAACVCHHHQAVGKVGDGLRVVARTADGVVEGLELPGADLVAVQWHPEENAATDPVQQRLFDTFVERAAARV
jgi:putative glutamine amidotransferase